MKLLPQGGNIGHYSDAKIIQIVLIDNCSGKAWNYFTEVSFSCDTVAMGEAEFITKKQEPINENIKLAISKYTIPVDKFKEIYIKATGEQIWNYLDNKINSTTELDGIFPTTRKFVPCIDPTGGQYQVAVPIEKSVYGSNYFGNYYVLELYSDKEQIHKLIDGNDILKIQSVINKYHLVYNLAELPDRIGNVFCRFNVEVIKTKPLLLGNRGIRYQLLLSKQFEESRTVIINTVQEHDNLIYSNECYTDEISADKSIECGVEPNQCKTTITAIDKKTGLIIFMTINDYTVRSNYYSQISPDNILAQGVTETRIINVNDSKKEIKLKNVVGIGNRIFQREMNEAGKRQQKWRDEFFKSQNYFKCYNDSNHEKAIDDIKQIINNHIIWDLQEIWLIDPYLSPNDILETIVFCEKQGIILKCITDFSSITANKYTKEMAIGGETTEGSENETYFSSLKKKYREILDNAIPRQTDMHLYYRTIARGYGRSFHDRYLILKYNVNKTRVWSLGTSINSLGKKHHIIQIVEAPELIAEIFQEVWEETDEEVCKIYEI